MKAKYGTDSMGQTAENVAEQYGVTRADQDAFALRSQQKAAAARAAGRFAAEIVPVEIAQQKGDPKRVEHDEFIRPDTSLDALGEAQARVPHRRQGVGHGGQFVRHQRRRRRAAARERRRREAVRPRACRPRGGERRGRASSRASWGWARCPPRERRLRWPGLTLDQMDVIELNEAFAAQSLACLRELGLADDDPRVNPNGGAIALGHPLGMSGARLALTAVRELERTGKRYALCTLCIGVGQGMADDPGARLMRLQSYAMGEWVTGTGKATELVDAVTRRGDRRGVERRARLRGDGGVRAHGRRTRAPQDDLPRARADAQGAREVPDGPQGGVLRALRRDRRDANGLLDRHRGRHRHAVLVLAAAAAATCPNETVLRGRRHGGAVERRHVRRPGTSACRSRASPCTSTRSTSRAGGCSRSSRPRCSRACRPS